MESRNRSFRRLVGALNARLPELGLAQVDDPRSEYNRDWRLVSLLTAGVAGCAAGCKGLGEVESLTEALAQPLRPLLGIGRRVPDTTLRDILVKVEPDQLRQCLQRQVKSKATPAGSQTQGPFTSRTALRDCEYRREIYKDAQMG